MDNPEILHELASEKNMRIRLEEECGKLQGLVILLESQLKLKTQEIQSLKSEHESVCINLNQQISQLKSKLETCGVENESLRNSLSNMKSDYFSLTDKDIAKASKIDELYSTLSQYQQDIKSLESELYRAQDEILSTKSEHSRLLQKFLIPKHHKFVQADPSPLSSKSSPFLSQSDFPHSPLQSLTKTKSQILSLQKAKSRIDLQIRLLSKFD